VVEVIDAQLDGKQAGVGSLGNIANIVSAFGGQRLLRWALQAEARAIMSNERIVHCLRVPHSFAVDMLYDPQHHAMHYAGLVTCGSVWMCPLCGAKISERRKGELEHALGVCNSREMAVFMATYTVRHQRFDRLSSLLQAFLGAHRRTKQGRAYQAFKRDFGLVGTIRALEVTWGYDTSWHPHAHELIVFRAGDINAKACENALRHSWSSATKLEGLTVNQHGFKLDRTFGAVQDYVAKWGHEPLQRPWGVESELSKAHIKRGRSETRFTPFGLLYAISQGRDDLVPVFREYATYFKGKNQLVWSKGLKHLLGVGEKTDEEIAAEVREEDVLFGRLTHQQWRFVLANDCRGELLEVALGCGWEAVRDYLLTLGCEI
jgi:hypothetical protein